MHLGVATTKPIPDPQSGLAVGCFDGCHASGEELPFKPWSIKRGSECWHPSKHPLGLNGLHSRNTTGVWHTLYDRPGLSSRDRGKLGPSGDSNAQPNGIDAATVRWGGCFVVASSNDYRKPLLVGDMAVGHSEFLR